MIFLEVYLQPSDIIGIFKTTRSKDNNWGDKQKHDGT